MILLSLGGTIAIIAVVVVLFIIVLWIISTYNTLVQLRNKVKNGFSQIDVQLKRRFDLIPNLVETAKGYAKHEENIFGEFAKARNQFAQASKEQNIEGMAQAEKGLSGALSRLLVVKESYPELKADTNFTKLMSELSETEKQVAYSRQFYNDIVLKYNSKVEMFPGNIVSGMFKFEVAKFFEISDEKEKEAPKVSF